MEKQRLGLICHDYFAMLGGGERLVLSLAQAQNWPIMAGFVQSKLLTDSSLTQRPDSLNAHERIAPLRLLSLIHKWQSFRPQADLKWIVYSGVYAPLAGKNSQAKNILYCHTPPRFVYDKRDYYLQQLPAWQRVVFSGLIEYFKKKYEASLQDMDIILANSQHIQKRIKAHLGVDSQLVYPPCDTDGFRWQGQEDYYLSTARLDGLKRVENIVKAFIQMPDKKLLVASGGPELDRLRALASDAHNIQFTGWISQEKLYQLVNRCIATIYIPRDEDFGISPVESMAAGKPVIGVNEGGLQETIIDGETGFLLDGEGDLTQQLIEKIPYLDAETAKAFRSSCEQQAQNFSREIFIAGMRRFF